MAYIPETDDLSRHRGRPGMSRDGVPEAVVGVTLTLLPGEVMGRVCLGGAAAIGTVVLVGTELDVGVVPVLEGVLEIGVGGWERADGRVGMGAEDTEVWLVEFLREVFLPALAPAPAATLLPPPRLRFLMTSVLRARGRTTPWSLRNRPQALHRNWPSALRRQRGVVCVKQLEHDVVAPAGSAFFVEPGLGLAGREGELLLGPELGECGDLKPLLFALLLAVMLLVLSPPCRRSWVAFGVDIVRGIFCLLGSGSRLRNSVTDAADPCVRFRLPS